MTSSSGADQDVVRRVVDGVPSMLAYWDRELVCRFANHAYSVWFGVSPEKLLGRNIRELLGPSLFELNEPYIRGALAGQPQLFERVVPGADGVQRHSLATYTPDLRDGEVHGFVAHVTEVTALKRLEGELHRNIEVLEAEIERRRRTEDLQQTHLRERAEAIALQESRFRSIFEGSLIAKLAVDQQGRILLVNRQAERLFGYPREELVGQPLEMLLPERFRTQHTGLVRAFLDAPSARGMGVGRDLRARRRDGSEVPVEIGLNPIHGPEGQSILASIIDITARKQKEDELRRSNAALEEFAYVASHDLQEPLRMVANYTELLAQRYRGQLDEKADRYIHYAVDGARRMQRLVSDLLLYSRAGTQAAPMAPVVLDRVVAQVRESLRASITTSRATLEVGPLPTVMGDAGQLEQVFQNLIANAIKFRGEADPVVKISAEPVEPGWRILVADNGIGLDMRYASRIFQMFQRLHEIGKYEGSGIGLALVKRIVERHGGTVSVESSPGRGARFDVTLPAATEERT